MKTIAKNRINTTEEQHTELLEVAKTLRNYVKKYLNRDYIRVFTEPRKDGVRTKFWYTSTSQLARMEDACNGILEIHYDGRFTATVTQARNGYGAHSVSIHIKRVK